jgi:lipopolysaccharide/colanic/teichoic acid biosynthesis glycosyltransferase
MTVQMNDLADDMGKICVSAGLVEVEHRPGLYRNVLKRLFDLSAVFLGSVVVVPTIAILALIVARDGSSPFYWNDRVGRYGRNFRMLKLRTMVPDAEAMLQRYLAANPDAKAEWDASQKLKNDPRITTIGRFLRKSSLDELPQLWNVVTGDMSLVGPRPMMPDQRPLYAGTAYYALRPGITGIWQVSDRNESEFAKRVEYDQMYNETVSFKTDVYLIFATFRVVFKATGY